MKAWTCPRYGGSEALALADLPDPRPGPGEIVVKVAAASVSSGDARVRGCRFPTGMRLPGRLALGWRGPRQPVLGTDCAGIVEEVGPGADRAEVGDAVLVVAGAAMGCHAERVRAGAKHLVLPLPDRLGWDEAVSLPFGGQTARYFLDKAGLAPGMEVLVIGAAGAVGSAAVQLVALAGARVVAVSRQENAAWLSGLGVSEVLDYRSPGYPGPSGRYDLVMDCVGAGGFREFARLAKPGGAYLAVAGGLPEFLARQRGGVRCVTGYVPESASMVKELLDLAAAGAFQPVVGERFPFDRLPEAHALADSGRKRGTAVVETDLCPERDASQVK